MIKMEKGKRHSIWLPAELNKKSEETRKKLGLGISAFCRFAICEVIKDMQKKEKPKK